MCHISALFRLRKLTFFKARHTRSSFKSIVVVVLPIAHNRFQPNGKEHKTEKKQCERKRVNPLAMVAKTKWHYANELYTFFFQFVHWFFFFYQLHTLNSISSISSPARDPSWALLLLLFGDSILIVFLIENISLKKKTFYIFVLDSQHPKWRGQKYSWDIKYLRIAQKIKFILLCVCPIFPIQRKRKSKFQIARPKKKTEPTTEKK